MHRVNTTYAHCLAQLYLCVDVNGELVEVEGIPVICREWQERLRRQS